MEFDQRFHRVTNLSTVSTDNHFGPFFAVPGHQDFDFTLLFEDTILSILPSSLLLLVVPFRIKKLWRASRKVTASRLQDIKLALFALFSILQLVNLVIWSLSSAVQTTASVVAAVLSLATALVLCALSYIEHSRTIRPSSVINAYLLLTIPLDAAKVRTLWLRSGSPGVSRVTTTILVIKLFLLVVEAIEKRGILESSYVNYSPEATSGLYSRGLFWWLNPMFLLGFKSIIHEADLFPTDTSLMSASLRQRFQARWVKRSKVTRHYELILTTARCVLGPLAAAIFPRLCQTFFKYMQPLLIRRVTKFVLEPVSQTTTNQGWGLTAAYGLVYMGIAISSAKYHHKALKMTTMVRGILVTAIYSKTMDLSITATDESAAVTLMSTDVQHICDALALIHEVWACPLEIGIAIWLLEAEIGIAVLGPLIIMVLASSVTFALSTRMSSIQKNWLGTIQTRVDATAKVLQSMKGVKMLGLTSTLSDIIRRMRMTEIESSKKARRMFGLTLVCGNMTYVIAPGAAFTIFVVVAKYTGQMLNVSSAFTALSLISLLGNPIGALIFTIPPLVGATGCFDRIQSYLLLTSRRDHRLWKPMSDVHTQDQRSRTTVSDQRQTSISVELQDLAHKRTPVGTHSSSGCVVRAINCTLAWTDTSLPVIDDVSFEINRGLTMLVGPVGCGKSSLLKGILGEIPSNKGYIYTDSLQVAFVDQTPWIQHGTIRQNIIGMSIYEHKFYSRVVHACALDQDFDNLARGDLTPVGSAGAGLSGGQKLRVALARAVYSRRNFLILDDVFSGLDTGSEDRIFSRLLGRTGLLRELDSTVLLATHAAHRLSYADKIIGLDENGKVCEQGSFPELIQIRGYVHSLAARHTIESAQDKQDTTQLTREVNTDDLAQALATDDLNRPVGELAVYKYYLAAVGYGNSILALGLMASFAFFLLFPDLWIKFWTAAVAVHGNSVNGTYLAVLISWEALAIVSLAWVSFHYFTVMVPRSALQLHDKLLNTVRNAPLSFFTTTDIGQVVNRFSQDMNVLDFELPFSLFELSASCLIALIQGTLICLSAAYFALLMPVVVSLLYLIQKFYLRTSRQIRLMDLETKSPLYSNFIESLNGLVTIRAFGWSSDFEDHNISLLDRSQKPFYMLFCIQRWLNLVLDLVVTGLAVVLMILIVVLRERLDAGLVGLALLNVMNFNLSLTEIVRHWTSLETSLGAISRIKSFVQDTKSEHRPLENQLIPLGWLSQGSIALHDVSASYTADGPSVLNNITLRIPTGQKLGLVGRSGCGKSSFITSLFHMLEITNGTITIDGVDLSTIPREAVRQRLNVIPQDPLFVSGTIRANLDPFSVAKSDNALISALITVGLWTIVSRAGGLETTMDPENQLSHGQRQLFCLARAILNRSRSKVLILDEATASVDLQTDETMQRIIREEFKDFTIIAIAHRLGTIRDFDRVVVLDKGRIVEDGTPDTLLADENSWFRRLWDS